jgi:para-aminobenzoate synthetase component 1
MFITPCARSWEPLEVALRLGRLPGLAWLDGGLTHGREGRFSFVAAAPCETRTRPLSSHAPYALLDELGGDEREAGAFLSSGDVPRWVGYVAYDAAWAGGRAQRLGRAGQPVAHFARHDAWYAFDHACGRGVLVGDDAAACARLEARLEAAPLTDEELAFTAGAVSVTDAGRHRAAIRAALAAIREGDVYQINLARRFLAAFSGSALGLYLRMRNESPVPLGGFLDAGDHAVLGRSMERFLRLDRASGQLWTSPIKGTIARRGDDSSEARELVADPKEHAEHAMVVDLMRNDLSRVCEVGSVQVRELMAVLPFRDLAHLVSTVAGRARPGLGLGSLFADTFPPGSVTGTPKGRAVGLIEALESEARGVYTGAFGFVDRAGGCSFAVAIRTAVVAGGEVAYHAGGGIVAASDEARETAETELKAAAFVRALGGVP